MPVEVRLDHLPLLVCFACCVKGMLLSKTEEGSERGGGDGSPRAVSRHTGRHLSVGTCLFGKATVTALCYQGLWITLQQTPSVFWRGGFSPCVTVGWGAWGLAICSHSKAVSRDCDPQQFR